MSPENSTPLHIFIIDDDVDDQELLIEAFTEIDSCLKFSTAANGREGFNKLIDGSVQKPDLIIVDMNMPMINGKQFLTEIKNNPLISGLKVIMYSTSLNHKDIKETLGLGAAYYFQKPSSYSALVTELSSILNNLKQVPL